MRKSGLTRILGMLFWIGVGAAFGLVTYTLFLEQTRRLQMRNIDETLEILDQNFKTFDIVALENMSKVLFGADYVTALKVVTGNGFVVFNDRKDNTGKPRTHEFSERRESGELRRVGSVAIEINHDPNAVRNIALACLTGSLLSFLLVRFIFSSRRLRRELVVRRASENALREQEGNLRVLLNSLTEAVIATDSAGRVSQMNPVAERLTGWPFAESRGRAIDRVYQIVDSKTRAPLRAHIGPTMIAKRSDDYNENVTLIARDGRVEHPISQSVAPMIGSDKRISGAVIVFRDVTAELQAQQRIREMEKMQAIGVLAGGIAHDFNNLLGVISAAAEVISVKDSGNLTMSSSRLLETIVRTTRRGSDLTSRLLAVGHTPSVEQKPFSLHASIEIVVALLKRTIDKRFDIYVSLDAEHDNITGNVALFENALLNIGLNASQAMRADKGTLQIHTEDVELRPDDDAVRLHHAPVGPCVKIVLRDNGVGIPAENLSRVFEPFFTNRRGGGGYGLGLWAVYNTVRDHGGSIHVESIVGIETKFVLYLPVSFESMQILQDSQRAAPQPDRTILIVDDEADIRATLTAMLTTLGCSARVASGGDQAIRIFKEHGETIDAVIMDLNMPGMSGEDAIVEILKLDPKTPIIISSGYPASSTLVGHRDAGKFLFLRKPYLLVDLANTLMEVFSQEVRRSA